MWSAPASVRDTVPRKDSDSRDPQRLLPGTASGALTGAAQASHEDGQGLLPGAKGSARRSSRASHKGALGTQGPGVGAVESTDRQCQVEELQSPSIPDTFEATRDLIEMTAPQPLVIRDKAPGIAVPGTI